MSEDEEAVLRERLERADDLVSSGISLDQVRSLMRAYRAARQHDMGTEFGARCLELAGHYLAKPGITCKVMSCGVLGIAAGSPKTIVDVRLEVTE